MIAQRKINKMKLRLIEFSLIFIFYIFNVLNVQAVTVKNLHSNRIGKTTIENTIPSSKALEKQLGRKLKLKERFLFWSLKRSLKRSQKRSQKAGGSNSNLHSLKAVEIELMDQQIIEGKFLKIENNNIYLVHTELDEINLDYPPEDITIIPLSKIYMIRKRPKGIIGGLLLILLFLWGGALSGLALQNRDTATNAEINNAKTTRTVLHLLAVLTAIFTAIFHFPKKVFVKGNPDNLNSKKVKKFLPYEITEKEKPEGSIKSY